MSKLPNVGTTIFTVMSALANKHKAINLSQGFPNFKTDNTLNTLVEKAMANGYNQYAPMAGSMQLREAIANKFDYLYNSTYNPETEITVTAGATQAIFTAIATFVKQDDEVVIFNPAYDCYQPTIELFGGKTINIQLEAPKYKVNWQTVKESITPKTKLIIINTPQNPSGTVFSKQDMLQLQVLTENTNSLILSDEVYEHIIFDNLKHQSVCLFKSLKQRSIIVASFGKTFHNTGWKLGYACAPKAIMEEFKKVHQFNVFCVNHPMQIAIANYLNTPNHFEELSQFYQEKRDLFLSLIKHSKFKAIPSQGTYFQVLDYSNITNKNDVEFAKQLTIKYKIASIPLSVFNVNNKNDNMLRFCFAKTNETLKQAADILNGI